VFYRGRICRSWYGKRSCELCQFDGRTRQGFSLRGHRAEMWNGEIGGKELGRDICGPNKKMEGGTRGLVESETYGKAHKAQSLTRS
jgi:hypothetical protein